jgi:endonuclease/exonuclease/phosphatase family metal-dependent hydrolase
LIFHFFTNIAKLNIHFIVYKSIIIYNRMKLFSLNVWFSDYLRHERTQILTKYLLENDYDIIFLQEVIPCVLAYIYQTLQEKYPHIHTDLEDDFYGTCIISKYELKNREILKFKNTRMRRGLLKADVNDITFVTTHLESEFGKLQNTKVDQFNDSIELLSINDKVFLIGDTNLTPKNDLQLNVRDFEDAYLKLDNTKENKYTYDGVENPFLNNKIRSRIDRTYTKNIEVKSFDLEKEFIMSDHYGLKINI